MPPEIDISEQGAVADGRTVNTAAIQQAIDACHAAGGGRVVCGPGRWVTGTLELKSGVELHLAAGCVLAGSPDLADYRDLTGPGLKLDNPPEGSCKSLLQAVEAEHIAVTGSGELNGSGHAFFDTDSWQPGQHAFGKPSTERPRLIMFYHCRHVRLEDASLVDAPCWTVWLMQCRRVQVRRLAIRGDWRMNNQDGIDIDACREVTVSDCTFATGDDCLVLRAIQRFYEEPAVCEQVTITNCTLESGCQGIRVGCPGDGTVRHCALSNLTITNTTNGIRFDNPKRYLHEDDRQTADIHDLVFSNLVIDCRQTPVGITVEDGIALRRLGDLRFHNLQIRSGQPLQVTGSPETLIENVHFSGVSLATNGDHTMVARHCRGLRLDGVTLDNQPAPPA